MRSCKDFDGVEATEENVREAGDCLRLAFVYIDRTVDPPRLRYIGPPEYEIIGWFAKRGDTVTGNIGVDREASRNLRDGVYYVVHFSDGWEKVLREEELDTADIIAEVRKERSRKS